MSPIKELSDPATLIRQGKSLLDFMPSTPAETAALLRSPPRAKHATDAKRLARWFAWLATRVGKGQLVHHCVTEDELSAAWRKSESTD